MSTRGCIGILIDGHTHLVYNHFDSGPEGLGRRVVAQIRDADLDRWKEAARALRPTEKLYGPSFQLTDDEVGHIVSWVAHNVTVEAFIAPEDDSSVILRRSRPDQGLIESGRELALILEASLRHDPCAFFDAIEGRIGAMLAMGLLPDLSFNFLKSPFCEWAYLIDLDRGLFIVGTGNYGPSDEHQDLNVWAESADETGEIRQYASFPLAAIPQDWESALALEQVEK